VLFFFIYIGLSLDSLSAIGFLITFLISSPVVEELIVEEISLLPVLLTFLPEGSLTDFQIIESFSVSFFD
jgi:hypothetical protein